MKIEAVYDPETLAPAILADEGMFDSIEGLIGTHPGLASPDGGGTVLLATAYNHFARADAYEVIQDPSSFESAYRTAYGAEDPRGAWSQFKVRLSDFGMPDFDRIHVPLLAGEVLTFFARDAVTGLPYRVSGPLRSPGAARYEPMRLTPVAPGEAVNVPPGA
jgi:hypothetical protein